MVRSCGFVSGKTTVRRECPVTSKGNSSPFPLDIVLDTDYTIIQSNLKLHIL